MKKRNRLLMWGCAFPNIGEFVTDLSKEEESPIWAGISLISASFTYSYVKLITTRKRSVKHGK
jgi:hypothetical protein